MTISVVGTASNNNSGSATYQLVPPTMQPGDICIVWYGFVYVSDQPIGLPTGNNSGTYTQLTGELYQNDARDVNCRGAYFKQGATPDTSITVPNITDATVGGAGVCYVLRGVDQTTPLDVAVQLSTGTNTGAADPPAITPVTQDALVVVAGFAADDSTPSNVTGWSGWTNTVARNGAGSTYGCNNCMASKVWSGSGAENPGVWSGGNGSTASCWYAISMAFRPAPPPVLSYPKTMMLVQN